MVYVSGPLFAHEGRMEWADCCANSGLCLKALVPPISGKLSQNGVKWPVHF